MEPERSDGLLVLPVDSDVNVEDKPDFGDSDWCDAFNKQFNSPPSFTFQWNKLETFPKRVTIVINLSLCAEKEGFSVPVLPKSRSLEPTVSWPGQCVENKALDIKKKPLILAVKYEMYHPEVAGV